jgi:hypothetical protein
MMLTAVAVTGTGHSHPADAAGIGAGTTFPQASDSESLAACAAGGDRDT